MAILNTFHLLSAWLTIIMLSEIYLVSSECTSSNQCTELNKICNNKRNTCECMEGYNTNSNGTCIKESTKEDTKSFYKALVAVFSILIALVIISITAFLCTQRWKANTLKKLRGREERLQMTNLTHKPSIRQILGEYNEPKYSRQDAGPATEEDFERLVQSLKEDAPVFLNMINEVKRKLNLLDDKNTAPGMQYKALIRDISRVLHILNRKPAKLEMPSDGVSLLLWAENALKRFEYVEQQISTRNPIKQENSVNSNWGESSTAIGTQDAVL